MDVSLPSSGSTRPGATLFTRTCGAYSHHPRQVVQHFLAEVVRHVFAVVIPNHRIQKLITAPHAPSALASRRAARRPVLT